MFSRIGEILSCFLILNIMQLPEELTRLSEVELKKVLTPTNEYHRKYYTNNINTLAKIYKLKKRFKNLYIFEDLNTKEFFTENISNFQRLDFNSITQFKKKQLQEYLSYCSSSNFALYIKKLATDIFGENKIDVQINSIHNGYNQVESIDLIVHFPDVTITNSIELSNVMKDIYIKFSFYQSRDYNKRVLRLFFARTTLTDIEVANNYEFSHVGGGTPGRYSTSFCFGGVGLGPIYQNLREGKLKGITTFLLGFEDYLKWESTEGKPHKYLSSLINKEKYQKYSFPLTATLKNKLYQDILNKFNDFDFIYNLVDGKNKIKLSQSFINILDDYLTTIYPINNYYLVNGESCTINNIFRPEIYETDGKLSEVKFKGVTKKIKIIKTQEDIVTPEKKIHRNILNYIVQQLESNLYNYIINKQLEIA
jgi:hypothetical protein